MKKLFPKILIVLLAVLMAVLLVSCGKKNETPEEDKPNEYEVATYSVTFNSATPLEDFSVYNLTEVPAGTYIGAPKNSDGSVRKPLKTGYNFLYWSSDGAKAFDFLETPINSDLTLTAIYAPKEYVHPYDLTAKLVGPDEQGDYRVETGVYTKGVMPADTSLVSTYNSSVGALAVPSSTELADFFQFWYYLGKDENGKTVPVQFSTVAAKTDAQQTVSHVVSYTQTEAVKLYAMWYSQLPKITVVYNDSLSDQVYESKDYAQIDYVLDTEAPDMREAKANYAFEKWYYKKTVDGVEQVFDFVFDTLSTGSNPTNIALAAGVTSVFDGATLNLYAQWKPLVSIASEADFEEKLYNVMYGESSTEEQREALTRANIRIAGTLNFGSTEYKPLFDADHKFVGEIDGGLYDGENNLVGKAKIVGGKFGAETMASVFGNVAGTVKNLDFENVGLKFAVPERAGTAFVAGAIASTSGAVIDNCDVTFDSVSINVDGASTESGYLTGGLANVIFGGVVGKNVGGTIKNSTLTITSLDLLTESVVLGGVAGENSSSGKIENMTVSVTLASVRCVDNRMSADGLSYAKIGGVVGVNGGTINADVNVTLTSVESKNGFEFGGATASSTGGVVETHAVATLASDSAKAQVGGYVNVGGLVGKSEGYVINSYAEVGLYVQADSGLVAVGGLVGNNFSERVDYTSGDTAMGSVTRAYSTGGISVKTTANLAVYVGGIMGRNNKLNIASDFSLVNIAVENGGDNHVGRLAGSMEQNATIKSAWFADSTLTLNGETYGGLEVGTQTTRANFESAEFVIGTASTIKFDAAIWKITSGLPTLK